MASVTGSPTRYDAFMSYSRALDGILAPAFQREIERFAKPWYRIRSLRVFRDTASLTANPRLWSSIEQALARSDWFLLMASPEAARSSWVEREARWWLTNRSAQTMLIILTGGELRWDEHAADFDWSVTTALPQALRGALHEEPRWVDLRWLRDTTSVDRNDPQLRDCVADVAAPIRRVAKDELIGEHIRQHRRAMRLARGGVTTLAVLLVVAVVAVVIAVGQRNNAVNQTRIATARQLAALAVSDLGDHLDLAQLYAVAAYRTDDDPLTRSALFQAVTASPYLVRAQPIGAKANVLAAAGSAHVVVAGTNDGRLVRWDLAHGTTSQVRVGTAKIIGVAVDSSGRRVVASDGSKIVVWDRDQPVAVPIRQTVPPDVQSQQSRTLAISPSGDTIAAIGQRDGVATLMILDSTGHVLRGTPADPSWFAIGLPDDTTLTTADGTGLWSHLSVSSLTVADRGGQQETPNDAFYCCGFSTDAAYTVWAKYDAVNVIADQATPPAAFGSAAELTTNVPLAYPDRFAVSGDGSEVAVSGGGALYVAPTVSNSESQAQQLTGTGNVDAITFVGGDRQLVSATGTTLLYWNLDQTSRITTGVPVDATDTSNAGDQPTVGISPDGNHIALSGETVNGTFNFVIENADARRPGQMISAPYSDAVPVWSPDGTRLLVIGNADGMDYGAIAWSDGRFVGAWPGTNPNTPVAARVSPDGGSVVVVSDHGDIVVRRWSDGHILASMPGGQQLGANNFGARNYVAISADATTVYLVGADNAVHVVDVGTGRRHTLPGPAAVSVAAGADRLLVARADNGLDVWDRGGTRLLRTIPADAGYTPVLTAIPGGPLVARLTNLGTVTMWNADTGTPLGSFPLPFPSRSTGQPAWFATALAADPDGRELVSASADGAIVRWQFDPAAWIRSACTTAGRSLTAAEWQAQVNDTPPSDLACTR